MQIAYTFKQAAAILGYESEWIIRVLIDEGLLAVVRYTKNGDQRITHTELERYTATLQPTRKGRRHEQVPSTGRLRSL